MRQRHTSAASETSGVRWRTSPDKLQRLLARFGDSRYSDTVLHRYSCARQKVRRMDVLEFLQLLQRRWLLFTSIVVFGLLLGDAKAVLTPAQYRGSMRMLVTATGDVMGTTGKAPKAEVAANNVANSQSVALAQVLNGERVANWTYTAAGSALPRFKAGTPRCRLARILGCRLARRRL